MAERGAFAAIVLSVIAMAAFLALPMLVAAASAHFGLGAAEIGWLGSSVGAGSAVSSLGMMALVRRSGWHRIGRVAFALLLAGMGGSMLTENRHVFLACQCVAALGGGAAYSLALTALSDAPRADRYFGYSVAAQVAFQVLAMLAGPALIAAGGLDALLGSLIALNAIGFALCGWLPAHGRPAAGGVPGTAAAGAALAVPATLLALSGCFLFFFNVGAVWTYLEPLARATGFGADAVGRGLAIGVAFGIPGALLAAWCGDRFDRVRMIGLGAVATVVSLWLLRGGMSFAAFVAGVALYNLAWNFSLSFQYAAVNAIDRSGKGVAVAPAFHAVGAAGGPGLAALLVGGHGLGVVNLLGAAAVTLSFVLFVLGARLQRRAPSPALLAE